MDEVSTLEGRGVLINTILYTLTVFIVGVPSTRHLQGPGVGREVSNARRNIPKFVRGTEFDAILALPVAVLLPAQPRQSGQLKKEMSEIRLNGCFR
jgi:hypothetical protein